MAMRLASGVFMRGRPIATSRVTLGRCLPFAACGRPHRPWGGSRCRTSCERVAYRRASLMLVDMLDALVPSCHWRTARLDDDSWWHSCSRGASPHAYLRRRSNLRAHAQRMAWREKNIGTQYQVGRPDYFWLLKPAVWVHEYGLKTDVG